LTKNTTSPEPVTPDATNGVALTPDGQHLFATSAGYQAIFTYDVNPNGSLLSTGKASLVGPPDPDVDGVAISPDGSHLYTADPGPEGVRVFTIAANGSLTPVETALMTGAENASGVAITPDGQRLFASAAGPPGRIYQFAITPSGSLTPLVPAFVEAAAGVQGLSIAPTGFTLYSASSGVGGVQAFAIEEGVLAQLKGSPYATGVNHRGIAVDPQGTHVYVAREGAPKGSLEAFAIGLFGSLSPIGTAVAGADETAGIAVTPNGTHVYSAGDITDGGVSSFSADNGALTLLSETPTPSNVGLPIYDSLAISPNQPPIAAFTSSQEGQSDRVRFNATASRDPDGRIARYEWNFGDGSIDRNGSPTPTHTYPGEGSYPVTLTLTDEEGCSTTFVFTGQTAACNGSAVARAQGTAAVVDPPPALRLFGGRNHRLRSRVAVDAFCDEACQVSAQAVLVLSTRQHGARLVRRLKVRPATVAVPAARRISFRLVLPKGTLTAAKAAFAAGGATRAKLRIEANAVDGRGQTSNTARLRFQVIKPSLPGSRGPRH